MVFVIYLQFPESLSPPRKVCRVCVTLSWWWEGLVLREGGSFGIKQEVVEEFDFLSNGGDLLSVFVQDVFTHKLWGLNKNSTLP